MGTRRRLGRLLLVTVLAAGLATGLSFSSATASGTSGRTVLVGGFAGAVTGPPRPIDRDLERGPAPLRAVPCAAGGDGIACWIR